MEEKKDQQQENRNVESAQNDSQLENPINTGGKNDTAQNHSAVAETRSPSQSSPNVSTKRDVTGSDFDGQVSPSRG